MTDTSSLAITHATTDSFPVSAPLSASLDGANSDSGAPDEGLIKCICGYDDDDGRTVQCETCDTWQHLACFYRDQADEPDEDEAHNCYSCEYRPLDIRRAADIQRRRRMREKSEDGYRRKRSSVKATKKKSKSGDGNGLGIHQRSDSGVRDQPPGKKSKTAHRPSTSISAIPGIPNLPAESRKRRASASAASSPTKTSGPSIPLYSHEFLHLYDEDEKHNDMNSNLFVTVNLVSDSASWVKNPDALAQVTKARPEEIFNWSDAALDRSRWPALTTETITDSSIDINGRHPTWKTVKTEDAVQKDEIVGEITGKVGLFDDYCPDPSNRWSELHHPEPFVFFSPQLPLYIDGRREGNMLRYTRRSCRPNVGMKIFITNDVEYHFCFVAKEDIAPGSEITIMWYFDTGLENQGSGDSADSVAVCFSNTLANFGGCACGQENCLLANLDCRQHPRALESNSKTSNGKRKKTKTKPSAAPDSGRASTSRAGSESIKPSEEDDVTGDVRSTSGSARGQTISRDLSPTNPNIGLDLSSSTRERRKIADAEKQFQQLEHDQKSTKKKKRTSGPMNSLVATQTGGGLGSQPGANKSLRIDTVTGQPHSPNSALSPGSLPMDRQNSTGQSSGPTPTLPVRRKRTYVDVGIQCEIQHRPEWDPGPKHPRPVDPRYEGWVPMRVAQIWWQEECWRRHYAKEEAAEAAAEAARQQLSTADSDTVMTGVDAQEAAPKVPKAPKYPPRDPKAQAYRDKFLAKWPVPDGWLRAFNLLPKANDDTPRRLPRDPPPWPSTAAHTMRDLVPPVNDLANLQISMPPPPSVPSIPTAVSPVSAASLASPSTADPYSPQSVQAAGMPTPPPAKKKLSFADYLNRRGTLTTPTSEKTQAAATATAVVSTQNPQASVANAEDAVTPTKPSLDNKPESLESRDVVMADVPDST